MFHSSLQQLSQFVVIHNFLILCFFQYFTKLTAADISQQPTVLCHRNHELVVRAAVKPTPSIGREQMTYNLATNKVEPLMIRGRHDICVALRGAVVVEAAVAIALANFIR